MVDVDKCVSSTSSFIEKLWLFILIDFTSITLCNSFINESSALLIIVTSVLIVCLKMFGEKIRIESIIICFLSLVIDIVCNVVSLIIGRIANYFIGTQFKCIIKDKSLHLATCLLVKTISSFHRYDKYHHQHCYK